MLYRRAFLAALAASMLLYPALAATQPAVGQKAPEFELANVAGSHVKLSALTAQGTVVLVVLRGYPGYQCPFCNRQVQNLMSKAQEFAQAGARLVLVYPGPPQDLNGKANEFLKGKTLPENFEMLLDPGYEFTQQYGLRWDQPNETAYPSAFLIDRQGLVFFSKVVKAHGARTTAAEILEALPKPGK